MKVLMVCLGNICRSPMAEGILRDKAAARGINIQTDSAGTGNYHVGEAPDKRAQAKMKEKGHNISDLRARQFEPLDYDRFDRIFVMDGSNFQNTLRVAHSPLHEEKVQLMLNQIDPGANREVPDPYFGGDDGFEDVYQMLDEACEAFLNSLNGQS
jgi:protein-tyrosine phosphatase